MQQALRFSLLMPLLYYVSRSLTRREQMMYKKGNRVCRMAYHTSWIYKRYQKMIWGGARRALVQFSSADW